MPAVVGGALSSLPHSTFAYWTLLLVCKWAALLILYFLAQRWLSQTGALIAVLSAIFVTSAPFYGYPPGRHLEIALGMVLTFSALWALSEKRWGLLAVLLLLAICNREDALIVSAVAGICWLFRRGGLRLLYVAVGGFLIFVCVRAVGVSVIGLRPYYCDILRIGHNLKGFVYLLHTGNLFHPLVTFIITFIPLAIIAVARLSVLPDFLKAYVFTFLIFIVAMFATVKLEEPYHWYIVLPLFIIPAIYGLLPNERKEAETDTANAASAL
ncbi:MAG: hypothetical protein ACLFWB_08650 [Armatimonadota bacterium]